jgi:hypothetical protein
VQAALKIQHQNTARTPLSGNINTDEISWLNQQIKRNQDE